MNSLVYLYWCFELERVNVIVVLNKILIPEEFLCKQTE